MMEREINLLPPAIIASRSLRIFLGRLGRLMRFVLFLSMLVLSVIGLAYLVVWRTYDLISARENARNEHQAIIISQVQKVNAQTSSLKQWQTENVAWTPYLPAVLQAMPESILLTYASVDGAKDVLEIRGVFTKREALVAFQRRLEELSWVESVESPLSNFQTGSEARFVLLIKRSEQP